MGKKKKINELEDRYYDLLNENGVLEDRVKDFERRHEEEIKKLEVKIELIRNDFYKLQNKCNNMESQLKVLNNRTMVDYTEVNAAPKDEITFEDCNKILEYCGKRGATKEELDGLRLMFNKYVFGCVELFPIKEDNDG